MIDKNKSDLKFIIIFVSFWIVIALAILGVRYYKEYKSIKNSFENYSYIDIKENINNPQNIKLALANDSFFVKFSMIDEYEGKITYKNIEKILKYYLFNINNINNQTYETNSTGEEMCIKKYRFYQSMKELFNINKKNYKEILKTVSFINYTDNKICFDLNLLEGMDEIHYVGIKDVKIVDDIVECNLYYYSVYSNEEDIEEELANLLKININSNNLQNFNEIFEQKYNGYIEEKTIKFVEIPNGRFFKYQLLLEK